MSDEQEDFKKKLQALKPKKKKLTVPKELLEGANNYDEKLGVIKIVTEKEMKKVVLLIKGMLAEDRNNKK